MLAEREHEDVTTGLIDRAPMYTATSTVDCSRRIYIYIYICVCVCKVASNGPCESSSAEAQSAVSTSSCFTVTAEGEKPWLVTSWDVVDGITSVTLKLTEPGFARFAAGRAKGAFGSKFLKELQRPCAEAMLAASSPEHSALFDEVDDPMSQRKQRKRA